jgi:hypothetical protein
MIRSVEEFTSAFQAARCVSTPFVAIRTADPASTTHFIVETLKEGRELPPLVGWEMVRGLYAIGKDTGDELTSWANVRPQRSGLSVPCFWPSSFARTGCCSNRMLTASGLTPERMASGKFISASTPGVYRYEEETAAAGRRVIRGLGGPLTIMPPSKSEV